MAVNQIFEKQVKEIALVHTTNLFYTFRTIEKELQLIFKTIDHTKNAIEKIQDVCFLLNQDFIDLEEIYCVLEEKRKNEKNKGFLFLNSYKQ